LDYIHLNPVRHGLVGAARDWPHSTFLSWVSKGIYDLTWGSARCRRYLTGRGGNERAKTQAMCSAASPLLKVRVQLNLGVCWVSLRSIQPTGLRRAGCRGRGWR
jgi:hypothetical protein